ncbi:MAG: hypothetical protein E6Q89_07795, partial [Bacteroidia bacterium]
MTKINTNSYLPKNLSTKCTNNATSAIKSSSSSLPHQNAVSISNNSTTQKKCTEPLQKLKTIKLKLQEIQSKIGNVEVNKNTKDQVLQGHLIALRLYVICIKDISSDYPNNLSLLNFADQLISSLLKTIDQCKNILNHRCSIGSNVSFMSENEFIEMARQGKLKLGDINYDKDQNKLSYYYYNRHVKKEGENCKIKVMKLNFSYKVSQSEKDLFINDIQKGKFINATRLNKLFPWYPITTDQNFEFALIRDLDGKVIGYHHPQGLILGNPEDMPYGLILKGGSKEAVGINRNYIKFGGNEIENDESEQSELSNNILKVLKTTPNIIHQYCVEKKEGGAYVEYVAKRLDGGDSYRYFIGYPAKKGKPAQAPKEQFNTSHLQLFKPLIMQLENLHKNNIIHGDIKPQNMSLSTDSLRIIKIININDRTLMSILANSTLGDVFYEPEEKRYYQCINIGSENKPTKVLKRLNLKQKADNSEKNILYNNGINIINKTLNEKVEQLQPQAFDYFEVKVQDKLLYEIFNSFETSHQKTMYLFDLDAMRNFTQESSSFGSREYCPKFMLDKYNDPVT